MTEVFSHELIKRDSVASCAASSVRAGRKDAAFRCVPPCNPWMGTARDYRHIISKVLVCAQVARSLVASAISLWNPIWGV